MRDYPLEYALVVFPDNQKFSGQIVPELLDLAQRGIVRFIDIVFIQKDPDGSYQIYFGGNPMNMNYMPLMEGWNYTTRLYQPREEILSRKCVFPDPRISPNN